VLSELEPFRTDRGARPKYTPEEIYEDFEQWSKQEGKDPWKKRGFQMAFARLAEKNGAERGKSGAQRLWRGFDFQAGFAQLMPSGDRFGGHL